MSNRFTPTSGPPKLTLPPLPMKVIGPVLGVVTTPVPGGSTVPLVLSQLLETFQSPELSLQMASARAPQTPSNPALSAAATGAAAHAAIQNLFPEPRRFIFALSPDIRALMPV